MSSACRCVVGRLAGRVVGDELQAQAPRLGGLLGELLLLAVEEAVRRAREDHDLVLDIAPGECLVELVDLRLRDTLVRAAEEAEHRALILARPVRGSRTAAARGPP